ncbi:MULTISPECIES: hypothetical protein [Asaia]|uniref:hypothetical protein n=1 Tax=Asaia TaxID=91914 RepID=UPI002FC3886C
MSGKWTPGPWGYEASTKNCGAYVSAPTSGTICDCYFTMANGGIFHHQSEQSDANARLIAMSPEMFAALEALTNAVMQMEWWQEPHVITQARAVLSKAKGEWS